MPLTPHLAYECSEKLNIKEQNFMDGVEDVLKFQTSKFVKIDENWEVKHQFTERFRFNINNTYYNIGDKCSKGSLNKWKKFLIHKKWRYLKRGNF